VPPVLPQPQPSPKDPDSDREVFRSAGSIVLSWAWLIVAVIVLVDLAVQGRDHAALVTAVLVVAISSVVYACAWRPRIVADSTGITMANPLRDHRVPWSAVANVDVVNAVRVHCAPESGSAKERILYSWAVQASPSSARRAARRAGLNGQRPRLTASRYSRANRPPGATPGYGQIPEPARDALDRTSAEFTAGRLAERAQHARQASIRKAQAQSDQQAGGEPAVTEQAMTEPGVTEPSGTEPAGAGTAGAGTAGAGPAGAGPAVAEPAAVSPAVTGERPQVRWAWGPIAAMLASIALVVLVVLL
jgi:hypothetical protein